MRRAQLYLNILIQQVRELNSENRGCALIMQPGSQNNSRNLKSEEKF